MKIYQNIKDISDSFSVLVFDCHGVLWSGDGFFDGVFDTLEYLMKQGKIIYILSNSTFRSEFVESKYKKFGLEQGKHYTKFITNGEIVHEFLKKGLLKFETSKTPKTYYNLFYPNNELFMDTRYQKVFDMKDADFVYVGIPRLHSTDVEKIEKYKNYISNFSGNKKTFFDDTNDVWYDCLSLDPFMDDIETVKHFNLPVLSINPDFTAKENGDYVTRQGSIADELRKSGIEVIEFGKPLKITFENALADVKNISNDKILMIGDSIANDIKGANNFGIKSALVLKTGFMSVDVVDNSGMIDEKKLCQIIDSSDVNCDFFIEKIS